MEVIDYEGNPEFSVVVPVYRGAETIPKLCARINDVFVAMEASYEIILIDDSSPDNSWQVACELRADEPRIKLIRLQRNFGQHNAVLCGLHYASGDLIITMDDDLQNPPEEIPKLVDAIREDQDCDGVIGIPSEKKHSWYRKLGSGILNAVTTHIFKKDRDLRMASFRILRRDLVHSLLTLNMPEPAIGTMLLLISTKLKNVEVEHNARESGNSGYSVFDLVRLTYNNILNYSAWPLRIVSQLGLASSSLGIVLTVYFLWRSRTVTVSGWSTIVVLITFFSGLILFTLGIIGEYLVRIIKAVNHYPQFLIKQTIGISNRASSSVGKEILKC